MRIGPFLPAALIAGLMARPAQAGIVSIQVPHERLEKAGRALSLTASFATHSGNGPGMSAGGAFLGAVTAGAGRHLILLKAGGDYAEFDEAVTASSSLGHLRHQYSFIRWLSSDAFVQAQQDRFQRLASRRLAGGGPAFSLLSSGNLKLKTGSGAMYEWERYRPGEVPGESRSAEGWRSTSYLSLSVKLARAGTLGITCYLQPRLDDFGDVRFLNEASLSASLNSWLNLGFSLVIAHDSSPPPGVMRTDTDFRQTLGVGL